MKKWLVLLLAILMVVSLAACKNTVENTDPVGDDPSGEVTDEPRNVNEYVYTAQKNVKLYKGSDLSTEARIIEKAGTELHRVQIDGKASVIELEGESYYVQSALLTTADLYGKTYTTGEKTLYAKDDNVKLLSCASDTIGETKVVLSKNDEVKVVAEGNGWCKVAYAKGELTGEFFVKASQLSEVQIIDYTKIDYTEYFTSVDLQLPVLANVNLRIAPVVDEATLATSLKKGDLLTITGYGKGEYATWGRVSYKDDVKPGDTQTYSTYYVKLCKEDCTEAYVIVPPTVLQNRIKQLGFSAGEEVLYVAGAEQLKLRKEPSLTAAEVGTRKKGDAVQVVASGNATEQNGDIISWAMVKIGEEYFYVSKNYLAKTLDAAATLQDFLDKYPALKAVSEKTIQAKGAVNCKNGPDNSLDSGKALKAGDQVTLCASGVFSGATWYLFKTADGVFYCAGAELFEEVVS